MRRCIPLIFTLIYLPLLVSPLLVAPLQAGAATGEPVEVRAAVHPNYGRLVFEWPRAIVVDHRQEGGRLVLRFARPLAPDLSAVADVLRDYVSEIASGGDRREVILQLAPGVEAAIATYEERIVAVDLARGPPAAAAPVALRIGSHPGFVRIVLDWGRAIGFEATADGRRWRIVFDREADIDALTIGQRFRHLLDEASGARGHGHSELWLALKPGVRAEVFGVEDTRVVVDLHEPVAAAGPATPGDETAAAGPVERAAEAAPPEPVAAATPSPAVAPPTAPQADVAPLPPLALRLDRAEDERGAALDFAWNRPLPAAFLIRAGYLWSVFGAPAGEPVDLPRGFPSPLPGHLGAGELVEASGGQAIRFALRRPLAAMVERDGARWRVVLSGAATPPQAIPIERAAGPPRLRILAGEAARLVRLADPEVGDELVVWPLLAAGRGLPAAQRLVELELLPTAQGLAWRTRSDDVRVQVQADAVELVAGDGLLLSASRARMPTDSATPSFDQPPAWPPASSGADIAVADDHRRPAAAATPVASAAPAPMPSEEVASEPVSTAAEGPPVSAVVQRPPADPVDLGAPGRAGNDRVLDLARFGGAAPDRSTLQQRIAQAAPADRPGARLGLARWFLARALAPEALAVLEALDEPDLETEVDAHQLDRQRLTGAAQLLLERFDEAASVLEDPALDDDAEVALWRAALAAARQDWPRGARELARAQGVLADYPPALQLRLGLPAAEAAIETGSDDLAGQVLAGLKQQELSPAQRAHLAFYEGLALARRGALDRAAEIWRGLEEGPDYDSRVKATYARTQLLLGAGRLAPDEAVAKLAPARALWRRHPWEARMLEGLAELYRRSGDRATAIRTWHDLLAEFPALPDAGRIDLAMHATFEEALQQDEALGAVRAYALYRDFPELVAEGAAGDALRRRLATRLASLDLLDPAAELLDELVGQRLSGPAKAEAGADLAALWLHAPDPAAALAALERSQVADRLPAALERRRQLLHARALAAADRPADALALLAGSREPGEQRLQAEILWQMRDWPRLAATLEDLLARRSEGDASLSEEGQDLVIRLAVAYGQQADHDALARLRRRFDAAMNGQAGEPAFLMATMTPGRSVPPEAVLAAAAEHLGRVADYLAAEPAAP